MSYPFNLFGAHLKNLAQLKVHWHISPADRVQAHKLQQQYRQ